MDRQPSSIPQGIAPRHGTKQGSGLSTPPSSCTMSKAWSRPPSSMFQRWREPVLPRSTFISPISRIWCWHVARISARTCGPPWPTHAPVVSKGLPGLENRLLWAVEELDLLSPGRDQPCNRGFGSQRSDDPRLGKSARFHIRLLRLSTLTLIKGPGRGQVS